MPHATCSQCGFPQSADTPSPTCRQCGAPLEHAGPIQTSMALEIYLDHARENDPHHYLGFDAARVRHFESYLRGRGISPRSARPEGVHGFLKQVRERLGPDGERGYESTLTEFFKALTLKGLIPTNPMAREEREVYAPMDTRGFSEELVTFVTHQEGTGFTENLYFDARRIQVLEGFLARRDKVVRQADDKDLNDFMVMARKNFTTKQACGLALTIEEFYRVLVASELMARAPACMAVHACRDSLEKLLPTEEILEKNGERFKPMPDSHSFLAGRRRLLFFVGTGLLALLVIGVLLWQLLAGRPQPGTLSHELRQKVKEIKTGTSPDAPTRPSITGVDGKTPFAPPPQAVPTTPPGTPRLEAKGVVAPQPAPAGVVAPPPAPAGAVAPPPGTPRLEAKGVVAPPPGTPRLEAKGTVAPPPAPAGVVAPPPPPTGAVAPPLPGMPAPGVAAPPQPGTPKPDTRGKPGETSQPTRLIGCVEGNCQNGTGTFVHDDGARYIGQWRNGKKHGPGEFRFSTGGGYRGTWQNGHVTRIE
ncbi:hypothetical protein SIID45300_03115 [Candidatus Magnetaquicoccaceae bacterium FCR-1]|uniref:MORN repeat protein n=1 Tax=Candidatus Magnetaquiglobus chichijimensis TaxID=3141448 RepID=A0ABQ0CCX9_9PROT